MLLCLLEAVNLIRFRHYSRLPLWEGKLILASNHPSWLDVVILPLLYFPWWYRELLIRIRAFFTWPIKAIRRESTGNIFPANFRDVPVSTADKYNLRRLWWVLEGWNIFISRREEEIGERSGALRKAIQILEDNGRIILFPGGGRDFKAERNGDGIYDINTRQMILRKPKLGMGWAVKQTGATVVPIRLNGTDKVLPNKYKERIIPFLRLEKYFLKIWHQTVISVGTPLRFPVGTSADEVSQKFVQAQIELFHDGNNGK